MPDSPASPNSKPLALDAYEIMAERFARMIDTKPHNAYYERPTTLALLPDVSGLRVLDAGCGPGWYAEWLLDHGAEVVGVDASPKMIGFARQRTQNRADLRVADLSRPLEFAADAAFDLVLSALAIHYVGDMAALFAEFSRILKPGGVFVFSTGHPFHDYGYFKSEDYFATEQVAALWKGFGGEPVEVFQFRCSLTTLTEALWRAGFVIERMIEPLPNDAFKQADPEHYAELMEFPVFLCIRARKVAHA
jgi:SAM-dependent methyltransferase